MTLLKKLEFYRKDAKDAKKFNVKANILDLLLKNLCALCVLAVRMTFFQ